MGDRDRSSPFETWNTPKRTAIATRSGSYLQHRLHEGFSQSAAGEPRRKLWRRGGGFGLLGGRRDQDPLAQESGTTGVAGRRMIARINVGWCGGRGPS
jgi:hypothetical protein